MDGAENLSLPTKNTEYTNWEGQTKTQKVVVEDYN